MSDAEHHKEQILEPSMWVRAAEVLLASAAVLEPHACRYWLTKGSDKKIAEGYLKTQLMLAGYALENMLKALIVHDRRDLLDQDFTSKKRLPKDLRSHDLVDLAKQARMRLADDDTKGLLTRLTRHSIWAGRYPVPIETADVPAENFFKLASPDLICVSAYVKQDWENSRRLFQRANEIIETRRTAQRSAPPDPDLPSSQRPVVADVQ